MGKIRHLVISVIAILGLILSLVSLEAAPLELLSVKKTDLESPISASGNSMAPVFTGDGTKLIFISQADNLVTNDHNGSQNDIFMRDIVTGKTILVSVNGAGLSANGDSETPVASSNGNFFAFATTGTDFGVADTDNTYDIVWRDRQANVIKVLSLGTNGIGNGRSINPAISDDGRWVAFESRASNLVANDTNKSSDIFLRDTTTDSTTLVSANLDRSGPARGDSEIAVISADGKKVAFTSKVNTGTNNLVINTNNHRSDLYVFDLDTLQNRMIKLEATNFTRVPSLAVATFNHVLSADGRYLAFQANHSATNQIKTGVYWYDLKTDQAISFEQKWDEAMSLTDPPFPASIATSNILGTTDFSGPVMSADGQVLVFEGTYRTNNQNLRNVFAWFPVTGEIRRLTNGVSDPVSSQDLSPGVSADGRFVVAHNTESGLFVVDLNDGSAHPGLGNDEVPVAALSPDGSLLAYQTQTDDLVENERNQSYDVFIRDLADENLSLVSLAASEISPQTGYSWIGSIPRGISDDGRYVVFTSASSTIVTNEQNGNFMHVYVRDLTLGTTELVSVSNFGTHSANGNSFNPTISADGQFVAFESYATDLAPMSGASGQNVFVRSLLMRATDLASRPLTNGLTGDSFGAVISADGRHVVFQSYIRPMAKGYETNDTSIFHSNQMDRDTYLFSVDTWNLQIVSPNIRGVDISADVHSWPPAISGDGNIIAFQENLTTSIGITYIYNVASNGFVATLTNSPHHRRLAVNREGTYVYRAAYISDNVRIYDLATQSNHYAFAEERTGRYSRSRMASSFDGRFVAYSAEHDFQFVDKNSDSDVYVYDAVTATKALVSLNKYGTNTGNGPSDYVSMSGDGRYVAFQSSASDLVEGDDNNASDIFVRDLLLNTTTRVSSGPGPHHHPLISANGRVVVFASSGKNPVFGDFNNSADTYAVHFTADDGTADSDADGMSDSWEISLFGDLSRDGTGDADQDDLSDLNEFRAGTHPLDDQSTFIGQILGPPANGWVYISWPAVFGKKYRVDYRDDLVEGEWLPVAGEYITSNGVATKSDLPPTGTERRYYRIVIVDNP